MHALAPPPIVSYMNGFMGREPQSKPFFLVIVSQSMCSQLKEAWSNEGPPACLARLLAALSFKVIEIEIS